MCASSCEGALLLRCDDTKEFHGKSRSPCSKQSATALVFAPSDGAAVSQESRATVVRFAHDACTLWNHVALRAPRGFQACPSLLFRYFRVSLLLSALRGSSGRCTSVAKPSAPKWLRSKTCCRRAGILMSLKAPSAPLAAISGQQTPRWLCSLSSLTMPSGAATPSLLRSCSQYFKAFPPVSLSLPLVLPRFSQQCYI